MKHFPAFCFLFWFSSLVSGQGPVPIGEEFQVNTYTTDWQWFPDLTVGSAGEFVVVWQQYLYVDEFGTYSIQARKFGSDGIPANDSFQVNVETAQDRARFSPAVASLPGGEFVVAWVETALGYHDPAFKWRRFFADGTPDGDPFPIDMVTSSDPAFGGIDVASAVDGSFVVVWSRYVEGAFPFFDYDIHGRLFASDGSAVGDQFQINTYTTESQVAASVARGPDGDFVVVWSSNGSGGNDTSAASVQMRRFDSMGTAIGTDFQVNSYTTFNQTAGDVAFSPDGGFWVTWSGLADNVGARLFSSDGLPLGPEFQANNFTTGFQFAPQLAAHPDGDFVVVWTSTESAGTDATDRSIQGRRFSSDGTPIGDDFQVNSYIHNNQQRPVVAFDGAGRFVVSWQSDGSAGSDSDEESIQLQRLALDCNDFGGDSDGDGACDDFDLCPGFDDFLDEDDDGIPDDCDLCLGDNATGDNDKDGICDDLDCDDVDSEVGVFDDCGVCGGDNSTCGIFEDGFESGDTGRWPSTSIGN